MTTTPVTTVEWGAVVRSTRLSLAWTQSDLAERVGATREWVSRLESGAPRLEFDKVLKAASALGIEFRAPASAATAQDIEEADQVAWDMAIEGRPIDEAGYTSLLEQAVYERQRREV